MSYMKTNSLYDNYNYFHLGNKYEDKLNIITTSLPCEIYIEYELVRKVGLG